MKRAIAALLLALLPGALFAETVMLFTRMQPVESHKGANVDQFIAVEDGVEDQFFNSGHIIFDAGVPEMAALANSSAVQTDSWAEQTAKDGGANYLLIVNLGFPAEVKTASVPSAVSYRFMDLKTGSMLAEGSVDTRTTEIDLKSKKPYELCFAIGQKIAKYVMTDWSP
ncbi:MAG TPA: hypothetical protein VMW69_04315 [Spirochaetia bacterium]|nr:hypothetical protein [Spirochaetia bacterium]